MIKQDRPYVLWRRVSTKQQGESELGLEAQTAIALHFMQSEPVKTFTDVYSGRKLRECRELHRAIKYCKGHGYLLVIAKSDRFRNTIDGLTILDEIGEQNLYFCDLATADRTVLTMMFAMWERQAIMISINTKLALAQLKKRGVKLGRPPVGYDKNGKPIYDMSALIEASARANTDAAIQWLNDSEAVAFARRKYAEGHKLQQIVNELGCMYDDYAKRHPGEPNIYGTRNGCKPLLGTLSRWLRNTNPIMTAV